ncbi:MAG: hypothetical protein MUO26_13655 [Methanotrichaceae archaeon]|nr:hypothetical protein [Methanotrichaceae archaeon]
MQIPIRVLKTHSGIRMMRASFTNEINVSIGAQPALPIAGSIRHREQNHVLHASGMSLA